MHNWGKGINTLLLSVGPQPCLTCNGFEVGQLACLFHQQLGLACLFCWYFYNREATAKETWRSPTWWCQTGWHITSKNWLYKTDAKLSSWNKINLAQKMSKRKLTAARRFSELQISLNVWISFSSRSSHPHPWFISVSNKLSKGCKKQIHTPTVFCILSEPADAQSL